MNGSTNAINTALYLVFWDLTVQICYFKSTELSKYLSLVGCENQKRFWNMALFTQLYDVQASTRLFLIQQLNLHLKVPEKKLQLPKCCTKIPIRDSFLLSKCANLFYPMILLWVVHQNHLSNITFLHFSVFLLNTYNLKVPEKTLSTGTVCENPRITKRTWPVTSACHSISQKIGQECSKS